jgi:two-component system chemotaxis response regulator CheB
VRDAGVTFDALAAGAFDYVPKQLSADSLDILHIREDLIAKIKSAAASRKKQGPSTPARKSPQGVALNSRASSPLLFAPGVVAIGISTGGPAALQNILPALPADLPVPVLVVQHMPAGFTGPFAQRLNQRCAVEVREASHAEAVLPGVVYIAPAGTHMSVSRTTMSQTAIRLSPKEDPALPVPSIDLMMQSVALTFRSLAMGVIMTGMGTDGARGMSAIHREGGFTVGQDEASCTVYGMPRVCAEMGILDRVVPLSEIPQEILRATRYRKASAS